MIGKALDISQVPCETHKLSCFICMHHLLVVAHRIQIEIKVDNVFERAFLGLATISRYRCSAQEQMQMNNSSFGERTDMMALSIAGQDTYFQKLSQRKKGV